MANEVAAPREIALWGTRYWERATGNVPPENVPPGNAPHGNATRGTHHMGAHHPGTHCAGMIIRRL